MVHPLSKRNSGTFSSYDTQLEENLEFDASSLNSLFISCMHVLRSPEFPKDTKISPRGFGI
jgi:hypothetical protein